MWVTPEPHSLPWIQASVVGEASWVKLTCSDPSLVARSTSR
jgi:hypothetical protein